MANEDIESNKKVAASAPADDGALSLVTRSWTGIGWRLLVHILLFTEKISELEKLRPR